MIRIISLTILSLVANCFWGQNKITVRKSDTTFNSVFYSAKTFKNKASWAQENSKGGFVLSKKSKSYYVFKDNGEVYFFNEKANFRKVCKKAKQIDWSQAYVGGGRYYITNKDIDIFPFTYDQTGKRILSENQLSGEYYQDGFLIQQQGSEKMKMIKY